MATSRKRIETLNLWVSSSNLWLETQDKSFPVVSVSRERQPQITLTAQSSIPTHAIRQSIHGVLGIIDLPLSVCLIVVQQKRKVGDYDGMPVYRMEQVEIIPIASKSATTSTEVDAQERCHRLLKEALGTPYCYFSYAGDMTHSRQRHMDHEPSWHEADQRFLWNYHLGTAFLQLADDSCKLQLSAFLLKLIHGAVFIHRCSINGVSFVCI